MPLTVLNEPPVVQYASNVLMVYDKRLSQITFTFDVFFWLSEIDSIKLLRDPDSIRTRMSRNIYIYVCVRSICILMS